MISGFDGRGLWGHGHRGDVFTGAGHLHRARGSSMGACSKTASNGKSHEHDVATCVSLAVVSKMCPSVIIEDGEYSDVSS